MTIEEMLMCASKKSCIPVSHTERNDADLREAIINELCKKVHGEFVSNVMQQQAEATEAVYKLYYKSLPLRPSEMLYSDSVRELAEEAFNIVFHDINPGIIESIKELYGVHLMVKPAIRDKLSKCGVMKELEAILSDWKHAFHKMVEWCVKQGSDRKLEYICIYCWAFANICMTEEEMMERHATAISDRRFEVLHESIIKYSDLKPTYEELVEKYADLIYAEEHTNMARARNAIVAACKSEAERPISYPLAGLEDRIHSLYCCIQNPSYSVTRAMEVWLERATGIVLQLAYWRASQKNATEFKDGCICYSPELLSDIDKYLRYFASIVEGNEAEVKSGSSGLFDTKQQLRPWRDLVKHVVTYVTDYPNGMPDDIMEEYQDAFRQQEGNNPIVCWNTADKVSFMADIADDLCDELSTQLDKMNATYDSIKKSDEKPFRESEGFKHIKAIYNICVELSYNDAQRQVEALESGGYGHFPLLIYAFEQSDEKLFKKLLKSCIKTEAWLRAGGFRHIM